MNSSGDFRDALQRIEVSEEDVDYSSGEVLKGSYNIGRSSGDSLYWMPLSGSTADIDDTEDLMCYHLSRYVNAEMMESRGVETVDHDIVFDSEERIPMLRTDYRTDLGIGPGEVRDILGGGQQRRFQGPQNPGRDQDPWRAADDYVSNLLDEADPEGMIADGELVYAGGDPASPERHPGNWGINPVAGRYILLDLGEVPDRENFPSSSPFRDGHEMWDETGIRRRSRELIKESGISELDATEFSDLMQD